MAVAQVQQTVREMAKALEKKAKANVAEITSELGQL
jgi:NAD/NADP transhydrogenase beta subunit